MREQNNIIAKRYFSYFKDKDDLLPSEIKKLKERYAVLIRYFANFRYIDVVKRNDEVVALIIDECIIYTHRGIFMRWYANRLLKIDIQGWDNNYLYVVVANGLNKVKRLDISLPLKDEELIKKLIW